MGRLKLLKPALAPARARPLTDTSEKERLRRREQDVAWRKWYHSERWRRLRAEVLLRDGYTCRMPGCGRIEFNTSLLVCDHVEPHRGDPDLFWDERNLQCLCKACHDGRKQAEERRAASGRGYAPF